MSERILSASVVFDQQDLMTECLVERLNSLDDHIDFFTATDVAALLDREEPLPKLVIVLCARWSDTALDDQITRAESLVKHPKCGKIVLLAESDQLSGVLRSLKAGVSGYIPTSLPSRVVVEALRLIIVGGVFIPPSCLDALASMSNHVDPAQDLPIRLLNARELLIAEALRKGNLNKEISTEFDICESTVKLLVRGVMRKLKARNRTEVAYLLNQSRSMPGAPQAVSRELPLIPTAVVCDSRGIS